MRPIDRSHDERALDATLAALRRAEARATTAAHVEAAVMAAWDAEHRPQREAASAMPTPDPPRVGTATPRRSRRVELQPYWTRVAALAAGVALASGLTLLGGSLRSSIGPAPTATPAMVLVGEPILAGEPVRVVRMLVPATTLEALGVRWTATDPAGAVEVNVIVGEDGVARAIGLGM